MENKAIGEIIAALRKEKSVTQETLAMAVGVSTQAVSKWERGGWPDPELLPGIADYFGVSIDTLFGRITPASADMERAIMAAITNAPREQRMQTAYELCWGMEKAMAGVIAPFDVRIEKTSELEGHYSSVRADDGYTMMALGTRKPYFFIAPKGTGGTKCSSEDFTRLFALLSEKDMFAALCYLHHRTNNHAFTEKLIMDAIGVDEKRAKEMISVLRSFGILRTERMEVGDQSMDIYVFERTPTLPALLTLAEELISHPRVWCCYCENVNMQYDMPEV